MHRLGLLFVLVVTSCAAADSAFQQANALGALSPHEFPTARAHHVSVGFQRELTRHDRVWQTFGSGGPRAFQLAARLSF